MDTFVGLILAGLLLGLASLFVFLVRAGLFVKVDVRSGKPPVGKVVIAYKFTRGPYKNIGALFDEVAKLAPKNKCLGIYYDDPGKVEPNRLRQVAASILAENGQDVDTKLVKRFEAEDFKIFTLPQVDYAVYTAFPIKTMISIIVAVKKVYPKLMEYVQEHGLCAHPFLEICYDQTMHFMAPLSKQGDFYVPEAMQEFEGEEPYESFYSEQSTQDISQSDLSVSMDDSQAEVTVQDSSCAHEKMGDTKEVTGKA